LSEEVDYFIPSKDSPTAAFCRLKAQNNKNKVGNFAPIFHCLGFVVGYMDVWDRNKVGN